MTRNYAKYLRNTDIWFYAIIRILKKIGVTENITTYCITDMERKDGFYTA